MDKKKLACIVLVVAVVGILAFSNVWFFTVSENLQNQVNILETQKSGLQSQVSSLEVDRNQLQFQVNSLTSDKSSLETEVDSLTSQISSLDSQVTDLQIDVASGESEIVRLNNIIENLESEATAKDNEISSRDSEIENLNAQILGLNEQIDSMEAPLLVNVGIGASDNRLDGGRPALHVYGWVANSGRDTAYSSRLHVIAYFMDGTAAIDTHINLGSIIGLASIEVNDTIYYDGPILDMTRVVMTPEWTE